MLAFLADYTNTPVEMPSLSELFNFSIGNMKIIVGMRNSMQTFYNFSTPF